MTNHVTIAGQPVVGIYEARNGRCWYVTKRREKEGQVFLFGYVRCFRPPMLAEFQHLAEEVLLDMSEHVWKVPQEAWCRCPLVKVEDCSGPKIVCCNGEEAEGQPSPSYSELVKGGAARRRRWMKWKSSKTRYRGTGP